MNKNKQTSIATNPVREIVALHGEIMQAAITSLKKAMRIGELLTQERARLHHGEWLPWAKKHLPFTDRTARNYIRVFENRDKLKLESVSDLGQAYRLLAAPGAPPLEIPDGEELTFLKRYWRRASKEEQDAFYEWIKKQDPSLNLP